jgi:hypothetical protein
LRKKQAPIVENGLSGLGYEINVLEIKCTGFEPPLDDYPVTAQKNRALPFKAILLNENLTITNNNVQALPVIQVIYDSGVDGSSIDVTEDAIPVGQGTEGNEFVFTDEDKWQYNLKIKNYNAKGTYTVTMESGDENEYVFSQKCKCEFIIE